MIVLEKRRGRGIVGDIDIRPTVVVEIADQHAETVSALLLQDARSFGNVGERAIAVVVKQNVFAALQAGRPAGDDQAFIETGPAFGQRRGLGIEVDVVGDVQIEVAVAVVIDERRSRCSSA